MEKLCKIRDLQRAVNMVEKEFAGMYGICLNEGMVLCSLKKHGRMSAGDLAEALGLSMSNTSKVISLVEKKGFLNRAYGQTDKRQMYFDLTTEGKRLLASIDCDAIVLPEILKAAGL